MKEGESMQEITTVGLDLAKNVFHLIGCSEHGKEVKRKMLERGQMLAYFASLPPCLIGMEACASAHYWAREIEKLGHEVRLIPPSTSRLTCGATRTTTTMHEPSPRRYADRISALCRSRR
jgi:transposase